MRWVLMTPLGWPVEPEVNRIFAMVSGPTSACAASTAGVGGVSHQLGERRRGRSPGGIGGDHNFDVGRHGGRNGARERRPFAAKTKPG